jgi:hypothetical protein
MAVLPSSDAQLVAFCEAHAPVFIANAAAIGITPAAATAFDLQTKAVRGKLNAALAARNASKAATTVYHGDAEALRNTAADLVRFVKAFADASANPPAVYALAQIPAPTPPVPQPPPGQPTDFVATLNSSGSVTIKWKCADAAASSGAFFSIRRKLGTGPGAFALIGTTQSKTFEDAGILLGTSVATYIIQGFRNDLAGPEGVQFTIQFGVGGQTITSLTLGETGEDVEFKAAA